MFVLGLNCFHGDSSAALIHDGKLIAAAEEERFRRVKHWAGFPSQAIAFCLAESGTTLSDVDHVAINQDYRANFVAKLYYILAQRPNPRLVWNRWRNRRARVNVASLLGERVSGGDSKDRFTPWSIMRRSPFERAVAIS